MGLGRVVIRGCDFYAKSFLANTYLSSFIISTDLTVQPPSTPSRSRLMNPAALIGNVFVRV